MDLEYIFSSKFLKFVANALFRMLSAVLSAVLLVLICVKKFFAPLFPIFLISVNAPTVSSFL